MPDVVSIHSFLRGTGKTHLVANLATLLAAEGRRAGVVDADIASPDLHSLFGLHAEHIRYTLIDYLNGKCNIEQAAYDVTPRAPGRLPGDVYLIPASSEACEVADVLRHGYDVERLKEGFDRSCELLGLDVLLVDTHAGLSEETLALLAISRKLLVVLRLDGRYYQGTAVTIEVARRLEVPEVMLVASKTPAAYDPAEVMVRVRQTYGCDVAAVLPYYEAAETLGQDELFVLRYPEHPLTAALKQITETLIAEGNGVV